MLAIDSAKNNIDTAIGQIRAMLSANNGKGVSHWSAFILASCVIDYLAGYRYKGEFKDKGERYKAFIREYLNKVDDCYNDVDFYHHLRCGLVHSFGDRYKGVSKFYFTHGHQPDHLKYKDLELGIRMVISIENFVDDIEKAANLYFEEAFNNPLLLEKMQQRVDEVGTIKKDLFWS